MTEFITRNYGNKEFEIIIKTDSHEHYRATEDFARRLIDHAKPATNADRIRAMSDEDLAHHLEQLPICKEKAAECIKTEYRCGECLLEWLQQPADENPAMQGG